MQDDNVTLTFPEPVKPEEEPPEPAEVEPEPVEPEAEPEPVRNTITHRAK